MTVKSDSFKKLRNGEITKETINRVKNRINHQINKAKNKFYVNAFEVFKSRSNKKWEILSELVGNNKRKQDIMSVLDGTNELTVPEDIANKFADFFSGVGQTLDSNLETTNSSPLWLY